MEYLKVWVSFGELLEELTDAECGRLFKAMLLYAETGETMELSGNERYVWPAARQSINNTRDKSDQMKANGSRRRQTATNESKPEQTGANESKPEQEEATSSCLFDKEKDKDNIVVVGGEGEARARETDFGPVVVDPLIVKVQTELNGLTDNHYMSLMDYREHLSDEVVSHAIDEAVANGVRNWAYVEAILRKYTGFGVHTLGEAKAVDEDRRKQKETKGVKTSVINPFLDALQRGDFSDAG